MATLTIRNLSDDTKARLRQLAARHGHSMEEEARRILNRAVIESEQRGLGVRIVAQFADIGGVDLEIPQRAALRPPPTFTDDRQ